MNAKSQGIFQLKGVVRNYDWGGNKFLSQLLSLPNPENKPMAEYWLGAHDTASSVILAAKDEVLLNKFIANDKDQSLGSTVVRKFGRLPFLLKVLDVKDMLSIQVHPSKHTAEIEFAKENDKNIPLNAKHRNYKDDNHKPELMVALSDFWLLHGFKPVNELRKKLQSVPELRSLLKIFDSTGYDQLYKTVMEMPQQSVNELLQPLLNRIIPLYQRDELERNNEDFWAARAAITFNDAGHIDRGIFSIYFFNLVELKPGEGVFQDAGVPHAYLEGQNVEIMANSDNVLRGGLTTKHVDVKELMKNIKFEETLPDILHPESSKKGEEIYRTAAPDFRLSRFVLGNNDSVSIQSLTGEIILIVKGDVEVKENDVRLPLHKGDAAFIMGHQHVTISSASDSELYRASVPVHTFE